MPVTPGKASFTGATTEVSSGGATVVKSGGFFHWCDHGVSSRHATQSHLTERFSPWSNLWRVNNLLLQRACNIFNIYSGCMAERLKEKVLEVEKSVDFVAGPDSYKDLPRLLALTRCNQKAVNVLLSLDETYADIMPVRLNQDNVTSYV